MQYISVNMKPVENGKGGFILVPINVTINGVILSEVDENGKINLKVLKKYIGQTLQIITMGVKDLPPAEYKIIKLKMHKGVRRLVLEPLSQAKSLNGWNYIDGTRKREMCYLDEVQTI